MSTRKKTSFSISQFLTLTFNLFLVGLALSQTACSSMYRKRDDVATGKVKSAAVIAFIVKEPSSNKAVMNLNSGKMSAQQGGSSFYQASEVTDEMYEDFVKALSKSASWRVVPMATLVKNPIYIEERKKFMAPVQVMFLPKSGENWFLAKDVMAPKAADLADRDGRNKILNALGVDAVIVTEVKVDMTGGFSLNGFGPRRPRAHFDMKVYERDNAEPIWLEGITGEKTEESLGWTGFVSEERLNELTRKSADAAFSRIGSKIE